MLKVNIHNYEAYFLDYAEGTLSEADRKEVEKFMALHPEKFDELQDFEQITVPVEESFSFNKNLLKKEVSDIQTINDDNFDEFCVANLEGDLDEKATTQYKNHLEKFPDKKKTEELFKKVYLVPDKKIKYPHKSKIKHFSKVIFMRRLAFTGAAAASIGLLFTIQNPFNKDQQTNTPNIVSNNIENTQSKIETAPQAEEKINIQQPNIANNNIEAKIVKTTNSEIADNKENISNEAVTPTQRQPMLIERASISNVKIESGLIASDQLAIRSEISDIQEESEILEENKKVSFAEYAFNEVKSVVPDGVQSLADKRPDLLGAAETRKKEIAALLNKQVTIEKEIDEEGKMKSFSVNTSLFAFYTTKVKK